MLFFILKTCWDRSMPLLRLSIGFTMLALTSPTFASNTPLQATFVGDVSPGLPAQLAVQWRGQETGELDVWLDLDADGRRSASEDERAIHRVLEPGIDALTLDVPTDIEPSTRLRVHLELVTRSGDVHRQILEKMVQTSSCLWRSIFESPAPDGDVYALTVWDDGSGPALYAGGDFATVDGLVVRGIARWDGSAWQALEGPSGLGIEGTVFTLAAFDDGSGEALYLGGNFSAAGGVRADHIARWDGTAWSAVGASMNGEVLSLVAFDPGTGEQLIAGGAFTMAGGTVVHGVASWNGDTWSSLDGPSGTGIHGTVNTLAVHDDGGGAELYAGGLFSTAGGLAADNIARWNGTGWSALTGSLGTGASGRVLALQSYDGHLIVGGKFNAAGGLGPTSRHLAAWNGSEWQTLASDAVNGNVRALTVYNDGLNDVLAIGGSFLNANNNSLAAAAIVLWDGMLWSALPGSSGNGVDRTVHALLGTDLGSGTELYVGGDFNHAGGDTISRLATWSGTWSSLGQSVGVSDEQQVHALTIWNDGSGDALYVGGLFGSIGGQTMNHIARWDGSDWTALSGPSGVGVDGLVRAFTVFDDGGGEALYVAGDFLFAGGLAANHIARFDGSTWSALDDPGGIGANGPIEALAVFDDGLGDALFAGGSFTQIGGTTVQRIAKWDGNEWFDLSGPSGTGMNASVLALQVYDDGGGAKLYAGGDFTQSGGLLTNRIARWDGIGWAALSGPSGTGTSGSVAALAVFDHGAGDALYAGGQFNAAGGLDANFLAGWDGSTWFAVPGALNPGTDGPVTALTVLDDGATPALIVGGQFTSAGGLGADHIARWDGTSWDRLSGQSGVGLDADPSTLLASGAFGGLSVWAGGPSIRTAGDDGLRRLGRWSCDATAPQNPTAFASSSHTLSTWSTLDILTVAWTGAVDQGDLGGMVSGLAGYSIVFDTEPSTEPDTTIDVPQGGDPHTAASAPLADSANHYAHLRACDQLGNCGPALHIGPFWIDRGSPSNSPLASPSHDGSPSASTRLDLTWTPATDTASGVEGYAIELSNSNAWTCDGMIDTASATFSATLGDGQWYAHLCAVDVAGNLGPTSTAGPFQIDSTPPRVQTVSSVSSPGDRRIDPGDALPLPLTQLKVQFNEAIDPLKAEDPASYLLVRPGENGTFETTSCAGGLAGDDTAQPVLDRTYDAQGQTAILDVSLGQALPSSEYRLLACGPTLSDVAGNALDGNANGTGGDDLQLDFESTLTSLLFGPNFDDGLFWWETSAPAGSAWTTTTDIDGEATSSAAHLVNETGAGSGPYIVRQCVWVRPGEEYSLAATYKIANGLTFAPQVFLQVSHTDQGGTCTGQTSQTTLIGTGSGSTEWTTLRGKLTVPDDVTALQVDIQIYSGNAVNFEATVDRIMLYPRILDRLLTDGFESGGVDAWTHTIP